MATGEKWTAQAVATTFDSGDIMSIVQSGTNKQVDHDVLMDDAQICKAWVNFNGTGTVAIRDDFNVSSITDEGTGDYTVNFTNALDDANYSITGTTSNDATANSFVSIEGTTGTATTSSIRVIVSNDAGAAADRATVSVQIFGS